MGRNRDSIGRLAVQTVKMSLEKTELLGQGIPEGDTEVSWDGHVYVYLDKARTKGALRGRVPVQVKGTELSDHTRNEITFSMETDDLRNYLHSGGIILFVVYIGEDGITNKIYYSELTPVRLKMLLIEAKEQKNKNVPLKSFPNKDEEKISIFLNFLQNAKKQSSFSESELLTFDALRKDNSVEGITIPFSYFGEKDPYMAILTSDVYMYADIKGCSIPQPIGVVPEKMQIKEEKKIEISIEEKMFYQHCERIKDIGSVTYKFGDSFKMILNRNENTSTFKFKGSDKLRIWINDLDFMISFIENGYFKMGEVKVPLDFGNVNFEKFNKKEQKETLKYLKKVVEMLDILGCNKEIVMSELEDEDWRNINRLVTAFVDKEEVSGLKKDLSPLVNISVGKIKFLCFFEQVENKEGTYIVSDFFKKELNVFGEIENGEKVQISQFSVLEVNDLLEAENIKVDKIVDSFKHVGNNYENHSKANECLLMSLLAYDESRGEKRELLKLAHELSEWLIKTSEKQSTEMEQINYLQVVKRMRDLNEEEKEELFRIIEFTERNDIKVGAYLLLEQQVVAEYYFNKLEEKEKRIFQEYPIYQFWK